MEPIDIFEYGKRLFLYGKALFEIECTLVMHA